MIVLVELKWESVSPRPNVDGLRENVGEVDGLRSIAAAIITYQLKCMILYDTLDCKQKKVRRRKSDLQNPLHKEI